MRFEFGATIDQRICRVRAAREQFLPDETVCDRPHKHFAMEFHCVFRGKEIIDLPDEERSIPLGEGQILLIPAGLYHGVGTEGKTVDRICFHFTTEEKSGEETDLSTLGKRLSRPLLFEDAYAKDLMELCRREQLLPASPDRNARLGLLMISTALRLLSLRNGKKPTPPTRATENGSFWSTWSGISPTPTAWRVWRKSCT